MAILELKEWSATIWTVATAVAMVYFGISA